MPDGEADREDLTPGRQREHPETPTASVQARIERDQVVVAREVETTRAIRASEVEATRTEREIDLAERRGEERGRLTMVLEGMSREIAAHTAHFKTYNGDMATVKATLLTMATEQRAREQTTLEYREEREKKDAQAQPWKIAVMTAVVGALVTIFAVVLGYLLTR